MAIKVQRAETIQKFLRRRMLDRMDLFFSPAGCFGTKIQKMVTAIRQAPANMIKKLLHCKKGRVKATSSGTERRLKEAAVS